MNLTLTKQLFEYYISCFPKETLCPVKGTPQIFQTNHASSQLSEKFK